MTTVYFAERKKKRNRKVGRKKGGGLINQHPYPLSARGRTIEGGGSCFQTGPHGNCTQ